MKGSAASALRRGEPQRGFGGLFRVISEVTGRVLGPTEGETLATESHLESLGLPKEEEETTELSPGWAATPLHCFPGTRSILHWTGPGLGTEPWPGARAQT